MKALSLIKAALKNKIFWYLASRYGTFAIQFLTSIWLAVKLGPYYFGIWSFILLLVNIGSQCNWGVSNAVNILLVQNKSAKDKCVDFEYNALILTGIICIVPFFVAVADTLWPIPLFAKYHLGHFSYAVAIIVAGFYLNTLFINIFRVKNRILEIAINQSLFPVMALAVVIFASDRMLLMLLVGVYVASILVSIILFLRPRLISLKGVLSFATMRTIVTKGFFLFVYNACFYLIMLSTKAIISAYYSVETFGYFAFAFSVANATLLFIDSLMFLLFPKMIDILKGNDTGAIRESLSVMRIGYFFAISALFLCSTLLFRVIIVFVPKYDAAFPIFVAIALNMVLFSLCFGYTTYMLAHNKEKRLAGYSAMVLVLNILFVWFFVSILRVSVPYSLAGTGLSYLAYVLLINISCRRLLRINRILPSRNDLVAFKNFIARLIVKSSLLNI